MERFVDLLDGRHYVVPLSLDACPVAMKLVLRSSVLSHHIRTVERSIATHLEPGLLEHSLGFGDVHCDACGHANGHHTEVGDAMHAGTKT